MSPTPVDNTAVRDHPRTATELVAAYTVDDLFFRSPRHCLLARGSQARLRGTVDRADLGRHASLAALSDAVAGGPGIVAGAVPFAQSSPARLFVPEQVWSVLEPLDDEPTPVEYTAPVENRASIENTASIGYRVSEVPTRQAYADAVSAALARIATGELDKVVLARALDVSTDRPVDVPGLLRRLLGRDPTGYGYAVPLGDGRTFLGASPELLVSRRGERVFAKPLAGSAPRSEDPVEDRRRSQALLVSVKDLREHALVTEAIARNLAACCVDVVVAPSPVLVSTAAMWHLATPITARVRDRDVTALDLALALHPTPAVCGTPVSSAYDVIAELEPFERGLFAGAVGWLDAHGDGEWAVAIRCAEAGPHGLRLFAGAGVVAGSSPVGETGETGAKFQTMLSALGIEHLG